MKFKFLSLKKIINNMRRLLVFILFLAFISISSVHAATYNYYFSNAGGGTTCSIGSPCATLAVAQTKIDNANTADTVNLNFNRGDTWSYNSAAVGVKCTYGLTVDSTDPIVNINAYGAGAKPIFDGLVTDFSAVPVHDASAGPTQWNRFFLFQRDDCSVQNIEIKRVYGRGIYLEDAHSFTMSNNSIHDFGGSAIKISGAYGLQDTTVTYNLVHTGEQLYRYNKDGGTDWAAAITMRASGTGSYSGNYCAYNVVYDIYGEGIIFHGGTVEYNVIGDTGSIAIYPVPQKGDASDTVVRYNFIIQSSSATYRNLAGSTYNGIVYYDEDDDNPVSGDNSNATIEIYGNTIINRDRGIKVFNGNDLKEIRVFNNTIIDSNTANLAVDNPDEFDAGYIYNNASILYDNTSADHVRDFDTLPDGGWTIDKNAFWTTGGSPTVDIDWRTNYIITDPKIAGEEQSSPVNWDGQSGATYYKDITFANVTPNSDSNLIDAGKTLTYDGTFLTIGSDYSVLPDTATFVTQEQSQDGKWDIGAIVSESEFILKPPVGLKINIK